GTQVHKLAQLLAAGEEVDVPDPLVGHVDSYLKFAEEWDPQELLSEVVVINRRYRYMGTLDLVTSLRGDLLWLIDFKTARSGVYPDNALQLAAYRNAESYIDSEGIERPMVQVAKCAVLWLRADGYDLIPVQVGPDELRIFLYALGIANWRDKDTGRSRSLVGEALNPAVLL